MTEPSLPLFFPEALQDLQVLTPRLRALAFSLADLQWLRSVELASHAQRSAQTPPMTVENILLNLPGRDAVPLAGSFMMYPAADGAEAVLYTPYGGLVKFDDRQALLGSLQSQLKDAATRSELSAFMAISRRWELKDDSALQLSGEVIDGLVFETQADLLKQNQRANAAELLEQLEQLPTLTTMLEQLANQALRQAMQGVEQAETRVSYGNGSSLLPDEPYTAAVLREYLHQPWKVPPGRRFSHPHRLSTNSGASQQRAWEQALKQLSSTLPMTLAQALQGYWKTAVGYGMDRRQLFAQVMSDKARTDLLLKRQSEIISPEQSLALSARLGLGGQRVSTGSSLGQAQKVRLWETPGHYAELAASLMLIDDENAYLYTQASGLQVLDSLDDLQQTLSTMVVTDGHADQLCNLLSLRERDLFLGFDQPRVSQAAISGPVFAGMLDDIIAKQQDSVEHVLQSWRNSAGAFDVQALFDQALDVRGLVDSQLLGTAGGGRWQMQPVAASDPRTSLVLALQAALQIKTLQSLQAALDLKAAAQPAGTAQQQAAFLQSIKPDLAQAMSVGIRGEARLRVLGRTLRIADKAIVDTVLNPDQPTRARRRLLNGFRPDAWSLTLEHPSTPELIPLANCLLLTERGGQDSSTAGRAIMWTPSMGLESFDSLDAATDLLRKRLAHPIERLMLLENLARSDYQLDSAYRLGALRLIERNVLEDRQQSAIELLLDARAHRRSLQQAADPTLPEREPYSPLGTELNVQRTTAIAQAIITRQGLPHWLATAGNVDLQRHVELLEQVRFSTDEGLDYLAGIDPLLEHARSQLRASLARSYAAAELDPDLIWLTPSPSLNLPAQTLTEFALNPARFIETTDFSITSSQSAALPAALNVSAVRALVLQLDIPGAYQKILSDRLLGSSPEVTARRQRFSRQLPWQLLLHAHTLKLQGRLTVHGYNLLQQVFDMPDAIARATVDGARASVRALALLTSDAGGAIKVPGVYLVAEGSNGQQVLYAPYETELAITEYTDERALLDELSTDGPLQALLIGRLPEADRATCRALLANAAKRGIQLADHPIQGNLLWQLFDDNAALLSQMLGSHAQPVEHSNWQTITGLFGKGVHFALRFLPGKLAMPLLLWHSYSAFKQSAEALQTHHWKAALYSFINGVSQMVALGKVMPEPAGSAAAGDNPQDYPLLEATSPARTQLHAFETTAVELKQLAAANADGVCIDAISSLSYVALHGKVYQFQHKAVVPRIVRGEHAGPWLQRHNGQWLLDPDLHSVHYGKVMSTLHNKYVTRAEVNRFINVEARGMDAIRQIYPERARQIVQSLDLARFYAFNSLHNLAQFGPLTRNPRLEAFIRSFFDVAIVNESVVKKIKHAIVPLCKALVDPTLDQFDHKRFVVGANRYPEAGVIAFVVTEDALQTVHFTEHFFKQGLEEYNGTLTQDFDILAHAQAATLIHEFSHLYSNTWDIATLEARRPFSDLISTVKPENRELKASLETFQRQALSLATPAEELFALWNHERQAWEDFDETSGIRQLRQVIREATGGQDMGAARTAFFDTGSADRRIDTILRNADSVARMICEMGRQLDGAPAVPVT